MGYELIFWASVSWASGTVGQCMDAVELLIWVFLDIMVGKGGWP